MLYLQRTFGLYITAFLFWLLIPSIFAGNLCRCECCTEPGPVCLREQNATFDVATCQTCTTEICLQKFALCDQTTEYFIRAICLDKSNWLEKVFVVSFIVISISMVILVILKIPLLKLYAKMKLKYSFLREKDGVINFEKIASH